MRYLVFILFILIGCKSVKKIETRDYQHTDSVVYNKTVVTSIDTTFIKADTAIVEAVISTEDQGKFVIESIKQEQSGDVRISYSINKTEEGKTLVRIKAETPKKEIYTQNTVIEEKKIDQSKEIKTEEVIIKKRTGFLVHLWWIIPLIIIAYIVYKKWPLIKTLIK